MNENNHLYTDEELEVLAQSQFGNSINIIRHAYVDIAGDLVAGALLGQILYWFEPDKKGNTKLRVVKDGLLWLVKERSDWHDEIRITAKQYDRAAKILESKNLIIRKRYKFNGQPLIHIRPNFEVLNLEIRKWLDETKEKIKQQKIQSGKWELPKGEFLAKSSTFQTQQTGKPLNSLGITQREIPVLLKGQSSNLPNSQTGITFLSTSLTETTTKTTAETTYEQQQEKAEQKKKEVVVSASNQIKICNKWEELFNETLSVKKVPILASLTTKGMQNRQINIHNPNEKQIVNRILHVMQKMKQHSYPFSTNAWAAISNALEHGYVWNKQSGQKKKHTHHEKIPAALVEQLQGQKEIAATTCEDSGWDEINQQMAEWERQKLKR